MKCGSCERENVEGAVFCAFCGQKLEVEPPEGPPSIVTLRTSVESADTAPPPPPPPPPPAAPTPPPQMPGVPYPYPAYAAPAPEGPTSGMAVASLVFGILGFVTMGVTSLPGLILGVVGLVQIGRSEGRLRGQGIALAGTLLSGFTLLMLPLMAAILFPVFARARERAQQASCQSNLKQIALGVRMYAADYDEVHPLASNWADGLYPYMKNTQLFVCPSEANQTQQSYAYNQGLDGLSARVILRPAEAVMAFDSQPGTNLAGGADLVVNRHNGGADFALVDGHVKWYSPTMQTSLLWAPTGVPLPPWADLPMVPGNLPDLNQPLIPPMPPMPVPPGPP